MRTTLILLSPLTILVSASTHRAGAVRRHFAFDGIKIVDANAALGQVEGQAGLSAGTESVTATKSIGLEGSAGPGSLHGESTKSIAIGKTGEVVEQAGVSGTADGETGDALEQAGVSSPTEGTKEGHAYVGPVVTWSPDAEGADFNSPCKNGGNMSFSTVSISGKYIKPEPLNLIISAASQFPSIQGQDNEKAFYAPGGFAQYLSGLDISNECLGFHFAADTMASVNGPTPGLVDFVYRENFKNGLHGTCDAALNGGLKVHGWRQTVTGAYFVGAQMSGGEKNYQAPQVDGYNLGRDNFAARAAVGGKDYMGCVWPPAKVEHLTGLCAAEQNAAAGTYNHEIDIDGMVTVVTVGRPVCPQGIVPGGYNNNTNKTGNGTWSSHGPPSSGLTPITTPPPSSNKPPKHMPKANVASSSVVALGSLFAGLCIAILAF